MHDFRRAMKQWRALMRLLEPFIPDAVRWRHEARDHARSLALARDGQSALNAFDDLVEKGVALSAALDRDHPRPDRSDPRQRGAGGAHAGAARCDHRLARCGGGGGRAVAARSVRLQRDRGAADRGLPRGAARIPADWSQASADDLHQLRQRVVDHRYQMELVEPLWPRHGRMWTEEAERLRDRLGRCQDLEILKRFTEPHQPLAHWRSRLTPACAERTTELAHRAARIAHRLFAERPKAFRHRLETLWEHGR